MMQDTGEPVRPAATLSPLCDGDPLVDEVLVRRTAGSLDKKGEDDVPAVAVGELLPGRERGLVPIEDGQKVLGRDQLLHRHRQDVVGDLQVAVLVEVVADAGSVAEQVFDRHRIVDQWEVSAEQRAGGRVE